MHTSNLWFSVILILSISSRRLFGTQQDWWLIRIWNSCTFRKNWTIITTMLKIVKPTKDPSIGRGPRLKCEISEIGSSACFDTPVVFVLYRIISLLQQLNTPICWLCGKDCWDILSDNFDVHLNASFSFVWINIDKGNVEQFVQFVGPIIGPIMGLSLIQLQCSTLTAFRL